MIKFEKRPKNSWLGLAFLLLLAMIPGCVSVHLLDGGRAPLVETRISGERRAPKILLVDIRGEIRDRESTGTPFGSKREASAALIREQLDRAREDDEVKALVLRIDSPGGAVTASDLVYQELRSFKREQGVPIVAQFMGVAASGGYYLAMASDEVRALPTTITGSIGVLYSGVSFAGLMEKLGIYDQTIVSGPYKDMGSPLQRMSKAERAQLQSIIDDLYDRFVGVVSEGRANLDVATIEKLADGRIYSANQALEAGLVDAIGGLDEGIERARTLAKLPEAQVVTYHRAREYRENIYTRSDETPTLRVDLQKWLGLSSLAPGFYYLWWPTAVD